MPVRHTEPNPRIPALAPLSVPLVCWLPQMLPPQFRIALGRSDPDILPSLFEPRRELIGTPTRPRFFPMLMEQAFGLRQSVVPRQRARYLCRATLIVNLVGWRERSFPKRTGIPTTMKTIEIPRINIAAARLVSAGIGICKGSGHEQCNHSH